MRTSFRRVGVVGVVLEVVPSSLPYRSMPARPDTHCVARIASVFADDRQSVPTHLPRLQHLSRLQHFFFATARTTTLPLFFATLDASKILLAS